jgi:thymidylate synthase
MEIIKDSTIEAWKATLKEVLENGKDIIDNDLRHSKEIINIVITIKNSDDITSPIEQMKSLKQWVYPELDELEDVIFKKETSSSYYYTYGARIFNFANNKDQVEEFIIPLLKANPNTRRAIIVLYQPLSDSKVSARESPCLISLYFKIIDKKLTVTAMIRSNDMFIGWPANAYHVYLLQKYVASKLGLELGSLTTISHSAHVFMEYKEEIEELLRKA